MHELEHALRGHSRRVSYAFLMAAALCCMVPPAVADVNGPTATGQLCMQKAFGTPVAQSNKLNCTANDIQISRATSVSPTSCVAGTKFDLTATFETIVTANARYDAGFFFRIDGEDTARGTGSTASGLCSLSALTPPPPSNTPVLELDGDSCGDLNAGTYEITFVIPQVECVAAEGTDQLSLPNCTSWHSNQGTQCTITNPLSSDDLVDFRPDTKSKCVCDDDFTVPVTVEDATIDVVKTALPTQVDEPGGTVEYTVTIENLAENVHIVIETITDDIYGDIGAGVQGVTDNTCDDLIGENLDPGEIETCSFKAFAGGDAGDTITDNVTVTASQPAKPPGTPPISDTDDADVDVVDIADAPTLEKSAAIDSCQVDATYTVTVNNSSEHDTLTVDTLSDDIFGDITQIHAAGGGFSQVVSTDCSVPSAAIDPLGFFQCEFVGRIVDSDGCTIVDHTNTVTADVTDDDGVGTELTDSAVVGVTSTP